MVIKILKIVSIVSFLSLIFYFVKDINLPFVGPFGNNNSTYSIQAKNYLSFGLIKTKFAPVNKVENGKFQYYLHHPPLLQLLTALSYKIFNGNFWWPGRFFPILSTLISIILMALIAKQLWSEQEGWLTLFFASASPFLLSFGKLIQFEPLLLCSTLVFCFLFLKFLEMPSKKLKILLISIAIFSSLIDWLAIVFFILFWLIFRKEKNITYPLISFVVLTGYFIYCTLVIGQNDLVSAYLGRSLGSELFGKSFAILRLIGLSLVRIIAYFSPLGLVFSIIYLLKKEVSKISLLYLSFGSLNVLLFINGAFAHPYWLYYLTPFFIFSLARMFNKIISQKRWYLLGIILLIINTAFSVFVIKYKDQQIKKSLWQDTFIDQISPFLEKDEIVATSWDFNEELFRYKTNRPVESLWSKEEIIKGTVEKRKWRYFIFSCWANCSSEDKKIGELLSKNFKTIFKEESNQAFLFDLSKPAEKIKTAKQLNTIQTLPVKNTKLILIYRKIRDFFGVNQI